MKWEKSWTVEEAVFWVLSHTYYQNGDHYENFIHFHATHAALEKQLIAAGNEDYFHFFTQKKDSEEFLYEVEEIYQALLNEIVISWDSSTGSSCGILDVEPLHLGTPDSYPEKCKVTKHSLANWFYHMGDIDKAKICYPAFDPQRDFEKVRIDLKSSSIAGKSSVLGSKSKNSYLRTIRVLADALLSNGLTDNDSGDARLILSKLAQKGKEAPLKERTLSNYLKEARELP